MINKTEDFLQELALCIERGNLKVCVEESTQLALDMEINAHVLLDLSRRMNDKGLFDFGYILGLAAAQDLSGNEKAEAYFSAAYAAQYSGQLNEAEENYKKAIDIAPKLSYLHAYYAYLLVIANRKTEAIEHYKKAIETPPKFSLEYFNYAVLLAKLDMVTEAEEHYKKAIEINPKSTVAHTGYAILLRKQGKHEEAEKHFKKAIEIDSKYVLARYNYANLLKEKMYLIKAEKEIRFALQIDPKNPYALRILGDILADEGLDLEEAEKAYLEALKNSITLMDPIISEIRNNLGWIYIQSKQYKKAKNQFKKAAYLDPLNVKALHNLRALGNVGKGIEPELSSIQKYLTFVLLLYIIALFISFLMNLLSEKVFAVQSTFLISLLIFILFYHQIVRFKVGTIEFEKSNEQVSQSIETIIVH